MKMEIKNYFDPILKEKCSDVQIFGEILGIALDEMKTVMLTNNGLGLAAPQVGITHNFFIIKSNRGPIIEIINPTILETNGNVLMPEGCLSAPTIFTKIFRPESCVIFYQDRDGQTNKAYAEDIEARAIQHEYDHLQGKLFLDHVNRAIRKMHLAQLKKLG